jgi:hypothetical protein
VTENSRWDSSGSIDSHLRGIGRWLIFFLLFAFLIGGGQLISDGDRNLRIAGWASVTIAITLVIVTINRWARLLPALFAYGALHVAFMSFDGHSATNSAPVSSFERLIVFSILVACSSFSMTFYRKQRLGVFARGCVITIVALFALEAWWESLRNRRYDHLSGTSYYNDTILFFSCVFALLLFNWGYDRLYRSADRK